MGKYKGKYLIQDILSQAGITINGSHPYDIRVLHEDFYRRVLRHGSLGFGEAYMDGWWECDRVDELFCRLVPSDPKSKVKNLGGLIHAARALILNLGGKARAFQIGEKHYDIGNELYRNMLDKRMIYSCAYWNNAQDLDEAQEAKLDLICRKLSLKSTDSILDIGCGWGGFARYAAEKFGARVVGITVSKEQAALGRAMCEGLPVEIRLQDYRDVKEKFDHVVSVGMFEHVGFKNHRTYMEAVINCLKDNGLFLLHTIGDNRSFVAGDPWFSKYIFPNSLVPSLKQISVSIEGLFVLEDWHNIGPHYDATLISWFRNFDRNWHKLREQYNEKFYRMWKYYLLSSAGSFRARNLQVWQMILSKRGLPGGYRQVR